MNKKEAKEMAGRVLADWIDEFLSSHELVYDEYCDDRLWGRRLSARDEERVTEAIEVVQEKLCRAGLDRYIERRHGRTVPADGKPGARSKRWGPGTPYVRKK